MEMYLFGFAFAIAIIIFLLSLFYINDINLKILFTLISFILFSALAYQSLNIEIIEYEAGWQSYHIDDYYLPLGMAFIFSVVTGISFFAQTMDLLINVFRRPSNKDKYSRRNRF